MSSTIQQLKEIGEAMGLKGSELATFIKEQQTLEREEREKLRQEEKEKDERLLKLRQHELEKEQLTLQKEDKEKQEKERLVRGIGSPRPVFNRRQWARKGPGAR